MIFLRINFTKHRTSVTSLIFDVICICLFKRKPDVVDLFSYFRGPFFLHPVYGPYFLVDVISVDLFSEHLIVSQVQHLNVKV